jgi:glycosyltransferase involved in cell wall biosynthesis
VAPIVSVVIPTRDRRDLLLRAVRSALAQDLRDVEVLVVDDGSTDGTSEALAGVGDDRVRVIRNARPVGVAAARNMGAEAAAAPWIAFLDDDDLWSPRKLGQQRAAAEADTRHWVYAGVVEIDRDGRLLGGEPPPPPAALVQGLRGRNLVPAGCSNVMLRAAVFRQVGGFDTGLRHLADWDLWLRLAPTGLPACVPSPLVAYRIHAGQATLDPSGMIAEGRVLEARHGARLNSIRRWLAWSHLRRGERGAALRAYAQAIAAGDVSSLARAAAAMFHPSPTKARRPPAAAVIEWQQAAATWLPPCD